MSIESVMPSSHLIFCRPLLLSLSIFPSIKVFSNESVLRIRWPNYWSFSQSTGVSANAKECSNYHTIALISHTSKCCSKFSKPGFNSPWTMNFQMFKLDLEKAEEPEIKLPTSAGSWRKQKSSRKTSAFALLTMSKPLTVWITTNCGKFLKRWKYQTTLPASWEICMQVKKQQLELNMEQ